MWALEYLAVGAFSLLNRLMGKEDFECRLEAMRLAAGMIFPTPVILPRMKARGSRSTERSRGAIPKGNLESHGMAFWCQLTANATNSRRIHYFTQGCTGLCN